MELIFPSPDRFYLYGCHPTFMLIKDTITILIINILEIQSTYLDLRHGQMKNARVNQNR